jgi:hypothetical protein
MNTDLVGSVELTASAAIVIAALSIVFGPTAAARIRIAVSFTVWFIFVVILAATRTLSSENGLGSPGLGLVVVLPIIILCLAVNRSQSLRRVFHRVPLPLLVGLNSLRLFGISFVVLYATSRLPAPFAPLAGWGDIFVGATATPLAWFAYRRPTNARPILWAWNCVGLADLVAAVGLGVTSSPGPLRLTFAEPGSGLMSTLPWLLIPGFLVPLFVAIHIGIFVRLVQSEESAPGHNRLNRNNVAGSAA